MDPRNKGIKDIVSMENPSQLLKEVGEICLLMDGDLHSGFRRKVLNDILALFEGRYPGYHKCNTEYHDLRHTLECLIAMTRLIHGAFVEGYSFEEREIILGIISALMHDTGYIQKIEESGTGARHTKDHIQRSIEFMREYFQKVGLSHDDFEFCRNCLMCTGLHIKIEDIPFVSWENEMMGKMLGTADLIGQMGERTYVEKLSFLFLELKEGGINEYKSELDLLRKTNHFYELVKERLVTELGNMSRFIRSHFRERWNMDKDPYQEAMDKNISYLEHIIRTDPEGYKRYLKRYDNLKWRRLITEEET